MNILFKIINTLKLILLTITFVILLPIKWISTNIIKIFTFIEFKTTDFTLYFLKNINK